MNRFAAFIVIVFIFSGFAADGSASPLASANISSGNIAEIGLTPFFDPGPIVRGPDGNIWVGKTQNAFASGAIARITPRGAVTVFRVGGQGGPMFLGSGNGAIWFVGGAFHRNFVGKMNTNGTFVRFPMTSNQCGSSNLVQGADSNMWFADGCSNSVARISAAGQLDEFAIPGSLQPRSIAAGSDGNLWFTLYTNGMIGRIDTSGRVTLFPLPGSLVPREIVNGPDGNLYVADIFRGALFRVTTHGVSTVFPFGLSPGNDIGLGVGADRRIWMVSAYGQAQAFDPATRTYSNVISLPPGNHGGNPIGRKGITLGSDGDMWFTSGDVDGGADYVGVYELGRR